MSANELLNAAKKGRHLGVNALTMTKAFFSELLTAIANRTRTWRRLPLLTSNVPSPDGAALCHDLLSRRGEASSTTLARTILDFYLQLDEVRRLQFFKILAQKFGSDQQKLKHAIADWQTGAMSDSDLHFSSEPLRQELFRRLNRTAGGTSTLVQMREHLLGCLHSNSDLRPVDRDFVHLFSSWFNRGFLVLKRIDWTTPANILERIIQYEAVHEIRSWDDLRNRLYPSDRRCFAFFHPYLDDEPLVFVEVALVKSIPTAIAPLLNIDRMPIAADQATAAVFYSISNTQKGLAGVSFGNFLIKQVVADLLSEMPHLNQFVTLSPVPGLASWLEREREKENSEWLDASMRADLEFLDEPHWHSNPVQNATVQSALVALAAVYLTQEKTSDGRPADAVARFHLGNGARLERLNFLADPSPKGLKQSHGIMVNYCYALDEIQQNHEAYAESGLIAASSDVLACLEMNRTRSLAATGSAARITKWSFDRSDMLSR
jgi:malonyl-CoA decarboxylase